MHIHPSVQMWLLLLALSGAALSPIRAAEVSSSQASEQVFSAQELDQMLAPLALYPDALLAQVLMAATYPGDVADAASWSMEHPDASGDDAVHQVSEQPWDPSVQSLVAFPAVLATLGQDPSWVQKVGDAFLAQPDAVMDSVQRLRRQAQEAGNLKSDDKQKVIQQPTQEVTQSGGSSEQTIIIESADPQVVYVPTYNPNVVYGTWAYPSYPPVYYPPPAGSYFGSALVTGLGFAAGVAVIDSLWGDCDWGRGDVDIDVNRYNNINTNRQLNVNENNWKHNAVNRDGVPYRDRASREQYGQRLANSEQREALRGRDTARTADRESARKSLEQRGFESPATSNRQARERAQTANREMRDPAQARQPSRDQARSTPQARQQARQQHSASRNTPDNAFAGARSPNRERASQQRGQASRAAASRPQAARTSGRAVSRPAMASSRGGARGGRR
ncbi:DUF3300 domain-containing protein [Serpens gallinarum]|uniref:DUF3300 domain-containing protein n=1 Tax=Serpens gallinarum TaxID=2763075 RepID=A0ABR8TNG1_9PSED|nr:DUF3300 domain-containing protein [Serpens gallinarum]MBD7977179.1 DUF3300 domain-containing protein [Serpens gallinarum]